MIKFLLAVSGGPDSMFMLNWYKKKNIVVAHVNYHKRADSNNDEKIVKTFCQKNNIPIEVLNVKEQPKGNFQNWAREVRYKFFGEIYKKYNCQKILLAHHKDDFLETAWMQMQSGRKPKYFGIKETNVLNGMNIWRPFLHLYWKEDILRILKENGINYAVDYTNDQPIFVRNKVRLELLDLSKKEKQSRYKWFLMSNKILNKKNKIINKLFKKWESLNYNLDFFRVLKKYKQELIYELIHKHFENAKLSSSKIEGLIQFIQGQDGSKNFYIDDNNFVRKEKKFLVFK